MKRYSEERKQSVLKKMMPPLNTPISQLVAKTGISDCTLYTWRKALRLQGVVVPGNGKNAEVTDVNYYSRPATIIFPVFLGY